MEERGKRKKDKGSKKGGATGRSGDNAGKHQELGIFWSMPARDKADEKEEIRQEPGLEGKKRRYSSLHMRTKKVQYDKKCAFKGEPRILGNKFHAIKSCIQSSTSKSHPHVY